MKFAGAISDVVPIAGTGPDPAAVAGVVLNTDPIAGPAPSPASFAGALCDSASIGSGARPSSVDYPGVIADPFIALGCRIFDPNVKAWAVQPGTNAPPSRVTAGQPKSRKVVIL